MNQHIGLSEDPQDLPARLLPEEPDAGCNAELHDELEPFSLRTFANDPVLSVGPIPP